MIFIDSFRYVGKITGELSQFLNSGKKPSEYFETAGSWLLETCILRRHKAAFLYMVDNCTSFIYPTGWGRTFRSCDYSLYVDKIHQILMRFIGMSDIDAAYEEFLENNLTEEQAAYKDRHMFVSDDYFLAYEIDMGNQRVINYVKNALESGSDSVISYDMISGVFMSKNRELHELVCRLLLAARLQEGLRQAICENCDGGRIEPFLMVLHTIRDNNLIRFSSVKRAVGCFLGLLTEESRDLERISEKSLDLILGCLEEKDYIEECLNGEDSMKIYIALWALACRESKDCVKKIQELIRHGTAHQAMTAGVFLKNVSPGLKQKLAIEAVLLRHSELDVMVIFLPQIESSNMEYVFEEEKWVYGDMRKRYDRETAEKLYDILNEMFGEFPKKDLEFSPCVFPWNSECLTKSDIVKRLCVVASDLRDDEKIDETCVKIPLIKNVNYYGTGRSQQIRMLLSEPKTKTQLDTLVLLAGDKDEHARKEVFEILKKCELEESHFKMLEDMLRYKAADLRQNLIDRICGEKSGEGEAEGYGLYLETDDFTPEIDMDFIASCKADFVKMFPETSLFGNKPSGDKIGMQDMILALDKLIEEHKNEEYLDIYAGEGLLADTSGYHRFEVKEKDGTCHIAFKELWDEFYEQKINDEELLIKLQIFEAASRPYHISMVSDMFSEKIFGSEFVEKHTCMHMERIVNILNYYDNEYLKDADFFSVACALGYYIAYEAKPEELYRFIIPDVRYGIPDKIILCLDGEKKEFENTDKKEIVLAVSDARIREVLFYLYAAAGKYGDHYRDVFSIRFMLGKRFGFFDVSERERREDKITVYEPFSVSCLVLAAYRNIISPGFLYKMLVTKLLPDALTDLSLLVAFQKSGEVKASSRFYNYRSSEFFISDLLEIPNLKNLSEYEFTEEENKRLDFAAKIGEKLIAAVLKTELVRGDTATEFSSNIDNIKRIYGVENFVKILAAMGKDKLDRSTHFSAYNGVSKKQSLSYLLGVCVPDVGDNAAKLKELVEKTDITENRIVEAALYSTAWLGLVEEYLGWKGFQSACYYFIAHMNESVDEKTKAVIAKYTPISTEDLNAGAFDIDWFKDVLQTVGEQRFDRIYAAAKYISDGAKHTRARKYADAVRGKLDKGETVKMITEKRNKDTLMAYALIPLKDEADMAERYLFIQEFRKQSKKFGAQRRASESAASDCALQNLAKNAGFSDVSRLTLRMETKLFEDIKPLLEWNEVEDIRMKIQIDGSGKAQIKCEKGGNGKRDRVYGGGAESAVHKPCCRSHCLKACLQDRG